MRIVYILQHERIIDNNIEDVKLIGVYSSKQKAKDAISRLKDLPGFKDNFKGFCIDEYEIDKDNWIEGFGV